MKRRSPRILMIALVAMGVIAFRNPILAEVLIWNEGLSERVAASTESEDLLFALIGKATRINTESQYQLMDVCYESLERIYGGRTEIDLAGDRLKLLNRAFSCHLAMDHASEAEMMAARKRHDGLLAKIREVR